MSFEIFTMLLSLFEIIFVRGFFFYLLPNTELDNLIGAISLCFSKQTHSGTRLKSESVFHVASMNFFGGKYYFSRIAT